MTSGSIGSSAAWSESKSCMLAFTGVSGLLLTPGAAG
eukprot:CAMPEP_0180533738 /NCGR_PEP_ID=MMETSP1036_2-20121128/63775_1 /TAXON_ID=632150 /ORGANISM="Azadinium spinosum, Strain 3D9" /LENGTH=36 /DNA_ID= /DNA_START= /DNA_END= /DNA_ORIENTATION=